MKINIIKRITLVTVVLNILFGCSITEAFSPENPSAGIARERLSFNRDWQMLKGDYSMNTITAAGDDLWETVQLPHDWAISRGPEKGESMKNYGRYPLPGTYWYRKSFELPEANQGKRIVLEFDEAMQDATVYLNGTQVGR